MRSAFVPGMQSMAAPLIQLMEELLESIEQRDAGDPDAPAWEACARIQRLEEELAARLAAGEPAPSMRGYPEISTRRTDEVLAGIA